MLMMTTSACTTRISNDETKGSNNTRFLRPITPPVSGTTKSVDYLTKMPFDTIDEKVVRQRRVRVCERCRREMPDVASRGKYNTAGSVAGSLSGSIGASALAGAFLGPIGMIGGAIAGSIAGARAGVKASNKACEVAEKNAEKYCQACKDIMSDYEGGNNKQDDSSGSFWDSLGKGNRAGGGK
jgi:hypothetical protein